MTSDAYLLLFYDAHQSRSVTRAAYMSSMLPSTISGGETAVLVSLPSTLPSPANPQHLPCLQLVYQLNRSYASQDHPYPARDGFSHPRVARSRPRPGISKLLSQQAYV